MSLKNYLSKILLAVKSSRDLSFIKLLIDSKKYSSSLKSGNLDLTNEDCQSYSLAMAGKNFDLQMRTYQGDIDIFYEIFWKKAYQIPNKFLSEPELIVDLGAHIGLTSIYFSLQYPLAKIYSVEASEKNFSLLKNNVQEFENVVAINKAIYINDGFIKFKDDETLSFNPQISEKGRPTACLSMSTLMKENNLESIDLLKIDIEGAEAIILSEQNDWLQNVENIIIELHPPYDVDRMVADLKPFGFKIQMPDEMTGLQNIFLSR